MLFFRDLPPNGAIFSKSTPFVPRFKNIRDMSSVKDCKRRFSKSYDRAYLCGKFMIYGKNRKSQETESQAPTVRTE